MIWIKYVRFAGKFLALSVLIYFLGRGCGCGGSYPAPFEGRVSFSPDRKYLVCAIRASGNGGGGIYRMDKDWTHPTRLTTPKSPDCDGYPTYSPDGLKVLYTRHPWCGHAEPAHLFVMNAEGTNPSQLTSGPYVDTAPVFSPDGKRIYFLRTKVEDYRQLGDEIFSMKSDGSDCRKFPVDYQWPRELALSPDGKHLIFSPGTVVGERSKLRIFSLETEREIGAIEPYFKNLPEGKKFDVSIAEPVYSPDGGFIFFNGATWSLDSEDHRTSGASTAIYRYNLETSETEQIADVTMFSEGWPAVSPDGDTIVFLEYTGSLGHIAKSFWSVKSDGANPQKIQLRL